MEEVVVDKKGVINLDPELLHLVLVADFVGFIRVRNLGACPGDAMMMAFSAASIQGEKSTPSHSRSVSRRRRFVLIS